MCTPLAARVRARSGSPGLLPSAPPPRPRLFLGRLAASSGYGQDYLASSTASPSRVAVASMPNILSKLISLNKIQSMVFRPTYKFSFHKSIILIDFSETAPIVMRAGPSGHEKGRARETFSGGESQAL